MAGISLAYEDEGQSFFHRTDPTSKFVFILSAVLLAVYFRQGLFNAALFVVVVTLICWLTSTSPLVYLNRMRFLVYLSVSFMVFIPLLSPLPGNVVFSTPIRDFVDTSIDAGAALGFRLLIIGFCSLAYVRTTHPSDVVQALARNRVPYKYAHALSLALVFLPLMIAEIDDVRRAQRIRRLGANRSALASFREKLMHVMFASLVRGVRRAQALAVSITTKGFGREGVRTYLREPIDYPPGRWLRLVSLVQVVVGVGSYALFAS